MIADGQVEWEARVPAQTDHDFELRAFEAITDGYLVLGLEKYYPEPVSARQYQMIAVKFSKAGAFLWKKVLSTEGRVGFFIDATQASDGSVIAVGGAEIKNSNSRDAWVLNINQEGEVLGQTFLSGSHSAVVPDCLFQSIIPMNDEFIITGTARDNGKDIPGNYGSNDHWAMRVRF
jgi:hypothetical protein